MMTVRRAGDLDAREMAQLLNEIIHIGGTTAYTEDVSAKTIKNWLRKSPDQAVWHVAEDASGTILGFQYIKPNPALPPEACDIATFVRVGQTGLGIGSKLFDKTAQEARLSGYKWINATIRADNESGLTYYQSRGFEDYATQKNIALGNGLTVDKVSKRFDL
jgi:L-amino acid N-acyltransferase YncA